MALSIADADTVALNRAPKLIDGDGFQEWKRKLKNYFICTDHTQWTCIEVGDHIPVSAQGENMFIPNTNPETFTDLDRKYIDRDRKAFGALSSTLSEDVYNRFADYTTAKSLFDALCAFYDGDAELLKDKADQAEREFNTFSSVRNEGLKDITDRFLSVSSKMKKYNPNLTNADQVKKLLDSLPPEWSIQVRLIKNETNFRTYTLMDVINKLKAFDLDVQRRGANLTGSYSSIKINAALMSNAGNVSSKGFEGGAGFSRGSGGVYYDPRNSKSIQAETTVPSETMELFGLFAKSYQALIAGELKSPNLSEEELEQVNSDDLEEADLKWNMAMLSLRAKRFIQRTGRRSFSNGGAGFDKSKIRCFNCKKLGHFRNECKEPIVTELTTKTTPNLAINNVDESDNKNEAALLSKGGNLKTLEWSAELMEAEKTQREGKSVAFVSEKKEEVEESENKSSEPCHHCSKVLAAQEED